MTPRVLTPILGRDELLDRIAALLHRDHNVMLVGPADIGKSALIIGLGRRRPSGVVVLDPFEHIHTRRAGAILRQMDRAVQFLAASRSLDRAYLGAVRRFAWRFTTVRVPPLSGRWMRKLLEHEIVACEFGANAPDKAWVRTVIRLSGGRPGLALAMARAAAVMHERKGALPSPAAAYIEARLHQARDLLRVRDYSPAS